MSRARRLLASVAGSALAGFAIGALECALLVRAMEATVATPLADSAAVAARYAVAGALLGALSLAVVSRLRRGPPAAIALATAALLFVVAGDWVHERALANVGFLSPRSLLATAGVALASLLIAFLVGRSCARRPRVALLGVAALLAGAFTSIWAYRCGNESPASSAHSPSLAHADRPRPNVVVVVIDTLRADRLGCYGYARETSPELDLLAARGLLFERAIAQAPMTRGSIASLFTSLDPDAHATNDVLERLPDAAETLAERFQQSGWRTACFSTNENVSPVFGFDQGFDTFWLHRLSRLDRFTAWGRLHHWVTETLGLGRQSSDLDDSDARHLTDAVLATLPARADAPRLLYVHYIDPHSPYAPPEDLINAVSPDPARMAARGRFPHNCPPHPFGQWPEQEAGIVDGISQLYDAEVRFVDREVGRLVRELAARGYLRDAFLVITADHGEEFFDHQQMGHGHSMYDELLRVPLIVVGPAIAPGRVAAPVQLVDLFPTLMTLAGIEVSAGSGAEAGGATAPRELHGRDLAPLLLAAPADRATIATEVVAPFVFAQRSIDPPLAMVRVGDEKLIEIAHDGEVRRLLFDLATDPREQHDLAAARPSRVTELALLLERRRAFARATRLAGSSSVELDDDARRVLKALGYVEDGK
jgi:arylsulfatase A-like enzyme